jgi:hypothetical protein
MLGPGIPHLARNAPRQPHIAVAPGSVHHETENQLLFQCCNIKLSAASDNCSRFFNEVYSPHNARANPPQGGDAKPPVSSCNRLEIAGLPATQRWLSSSDRG